MSRTRYGITSSNNTPPNPHFKKHLDTPHACYKTTTRRRSDGHRSAATKTKHRRVETGPRSLSDAVKKHNRIMQSGRGAGVTEPPTHGSPTVPAISHRRRLRRRAKRGQKPGHGGRCSSQGPNAECYAGSDNNSKPDGNPSSPIAKRKGTRASEASSQGMPVQGFGRTHPLSGRDVYPHRRAGEATALTRG